jgi:uncharacterized membrane protein
MRPALRRAGKALIVVACVAWQCWAYASVGGGGGDWLAAVSGLFHAACYVFLLWYFGRSLARGREAIVTRFARRVHGTLQPPMERFTRNVTVAWCVFFAGQLIVSGALLALAPLHAWALFINLLNLPLLALMFMGQFVFRAVRHPDFPPSSPWQAWRAYRDDASLSNSAKLR